MLRCVSSPSHSPLAWLLTPAHPSLSPLWRSGRTHKELSESQTPSKQSPERPLCMKDAHSSYLAWELKMGTKTEDCERGSAYRPETDNKIDVQIAELLILILRSTPHFQSCVKP